MYLKSLEIHGFKSFANKIVFDFHNGITGIVGPNGSGKSNVADAVRWVLGEQSAKQLRGSSMQDVIFAGTENRKPLGYAYVAITLDNSDHQLATSYEEVTVARRVYRSGESEYLMNGNVCRLKEIAELFYDTGIGKEGYSIIGQGQIDRILSGKPEERRELFDEAAGIVKFKKRKNTAQKKLDAERENLTRVSDILSELERQVGPLERQSEKARTYLRKRDELKGYDVNLFLVEEEQVKGELSALNQNYEIADADLQKAQAEYEHIRNEYEELGDAIAALDAEIEGSRSLLMEAGSRRQQLAGQEALLKEQIHTAEISDQHLRQRLAAIEEEKTQRINSVESYRNQEENVSSQIRYWNQKAENALEKLQALQAELSQCNAVIELARQSQLQQLEDKASLQGQQQRLDTMMEQLNIRKARLNRQLVSSQTEEKDLHAAVEAAEGELQLVNKDLEKLITRERQVSEKNRDWKNKITDNSRQTELLTSEYHRSHSRLETLRNIAERYDGYGNSIRKVMEQKSRIKGLIGVVSDLIHVEKKYEIAIETALGGSIQNIVTEDEETAKAMIQYLKVYRFGRATFLPLSSVRGRSNPKNEQALREKGAVGIASQLIHCDSRFQNLAEYLLGRILVVDDIDHATQIARKYHYSLNIVTLEGESLSPGGSMTGGAFRNSSNLLGRNREIEELQKKIRDTQKEIEQLKQRREDLLTAEALTSDELEEIREELQEQYIRQNTARMNYEQACREQEEGENLYENLRREYEQIEQEAEQIRSGRLQISDQESDSMKQQEAVENQLAEAGARLELLTRQEAEALEKQQGIEVQLAELHKTHEFIQINLERVDGEVERFDRESSDISGRMLSGREEIEEKQKQIAELALAEEQAAAEAENYNQQLAAQLAKKEKLNQSYRGCFSRQEEVASRKNLLDKELFRLGSRREHLQEAEEKQIAYLWEEYELTPHNAMVLRDPELGTMTELKKKVRDIKEEIRALGSVNVNAIEEYREVSARYTFLKQQHDDLIEAEKTLLGIIRELDEGMRRQFTEKFAEIQREFDASFRELFGGGHGTLELTEDEDILECGIRIIAQPPGKKLQNMMQLSGGEKALSAIALLFAIQSLKPSPFCLLDEIEAALDDSNVDRYANYLGKLTENTQFIVITHRRGTMAAADRLYGITMQEKGVSTLVSVSLIDEELEE